MFKHRALFNLGLIGYPGMQVRAPSNPDPESDAVEHSGGRQIKFLLDQIAFYSFDDRDCYH